MQRAKSSIFHKFFVVVLTAASVFTGTAWLANFRFPLAVLQTIGIADKVRLDGVEWYWDLILRDNEQRKSWISLYVSMQVLSIEKGSMYTAKQPQATRRHIRLGPIAYITDAADSRHRIGDRLTSGGLVKRLSLRSASVDIALWFLWPLFAAYPLWSLARGPLTLRHRRKHGLCLNCGYSLKQLTEPRCPECGCEIESTTSA